MLTVILLLYAAARMGFSPSGTPIVFRSHSIGVPFAAYVGDGIMALLLISIYWLVAALRSIERGGLFAPQTIRLFRRFASWLLVMALFSFIAPILIAAVFFDHKQTHHLMVSLDVRDLLLIGITALLFLLARLLERAGEIEQENREII